MQLFHAFTEIVYCAFHIFAELCGAWRHGYMGHVMGNTPVIHTTVITKLLQAACLMLIAIHWGS